MERRSSLSRRVALTGSALLLLVGLTGCNGKAPVGRGPVATVNGTEITLGQLRDVSDAQIAYIRAATAEAGSEQAAAAVADFVGVNEHTRGAGGSAQMLSLLIHVETIEDLVATKGIEITDDDRAVAEQLVDQGLTSAGVTGDAALAEVADVVALETRYRVGFAALQRGLQAEGPEERARAMYDENRALFDDGLCIQRIDTVDEASADEASRRVRDGEDFATVADAFSVQPELAVEGDDASCIPRENMRRAFGDDVDGVGVGDVLGPVDAQGTWVLVRIWEERAIPFELVRERLLASVAAEAEAPEQAVNAAIAAHLATLDVSVDPRYGTWDPAMGVVTPPTDPLAAGDDWATISGL